VAFNAPRALAHCFGAKYIGAMAALALVALGCRATASDTYGAPPPDIKLQLDRLINPQSWSEIVSDGSNLIEWLP
jgi:hypothetical protein